VLSLLPNAPFVSVALPWAASLPAILAREVPTGSVIAADPATSPLNAQAMAWQAEDALGFRIMGGYANVAVPGQTYGQRDPVPQPPPYLEEMPAQPQIGVIFRRPVLARDQVLFIGQEMAELRSYLVRYSIRALVFTGRTPPMTYGVTMPSPAIVPASYWYLSAALGPPRFVKRTYVIWLAGNRGWGHREAA
jgi:hypothetical protein